MNEIKHIVLEDIENLVAIHKATIKPAWSTASFTDMLNDPTVMGWKIQDTITIKGFIFVRFIFDEAEILTICVNPAYQRQGLGNVLLAYLKDQCLRCLIKKIFLEVNENNIAAISLYKKHNFNTIDIRNNYYKITPKLHEAALIMVKEVN